MQLVTKQIKTWKEKKILIAGTILNKPSLEQQLILFKGQIYSFFSTISWYHCHRARDNKTQIQFFLEKASWNQHCWESPWQSWDLVWIFGYRAEIVFTCPEWAEFSWFHSWFWFNCRVKGWRGEGKLCSLSAPLNKLGLTSQDSIP